MNPKTKWLDSVRFMADTTTGLPPPQLIEAFANIAATPQAKECARLLLEKPLLRGCDFQQLWLDSMLPVAAEMEFLPRIALEFMYVEPQSPRFTFWSMAHGTCGEVWLGIDKHGQCFLEAGFRQGCIEELVRRLKKQTFLWSMRYPFAQSQTTIGPAPWEAFTKVFPALTA